MFECDGNAVDPKPISSEIFCGIWPFFGRSGENKTNSPNFYSTSHRQEILDPSWFPLHPQFSPSLSSNHFLSFFDMPFQTLGLALTNASVIHAALQSPFCTPEHLEHLLCNGMETSLSEKE